jgi:Uncharacterised nucleotidyltransferase
MSGAEHLWRKVDELIDRAPTDDDLRSHRLEVLAAKRLRARGAPVPLDFVSQERSAAIVAMSASLILQRVREAYDGPALVLKGPEVAARYPDAALRSYGDVDLLVPDAFAAHRTLLDAGFTLVGDPELYVDIHHLRPLLAPDVPVAIEVHSRPKWVDPLQPPAVEELFATATQSATGVNGMLTLPPAQHAVLLAVHSWAHEPLRRLRDVVDIAAMARGADRNELRRVARRWRVERLWRTTIAAVDSIFGDRPTPWALRLWAQNLARARERTVFENHLQRWLSDFWAMPVETATARVPRTFLDEIRPEEGETWKAKASRSALALRHAARPRSRHDRDLDERRSRANQPFG